MNQLRFPGLICDIHENFYYLFSNIHLTFVSKIEKHQILSLMKLISIITNIHIRTCVSEAAFCGLQRRRSNTYSSWKDEVYFNKSKISCSSTTEAIGLSCQKIVYTVF